MLPTICYEHMMIDESRVDEIAEVCAENVAVMFLKSVEAKILESI